MLNTSFIQIVFNAFSKAFSNSKRKLDGKIFFFDFEKTVIKTIILLSLKKINIKLYLL